MANMHRSHGAVTEGFIRSVDRTEPARVPPQPAPLLWAALQALIDRAFPKFDCGTLWLRLPQPAPLRLGRGAPEAAIRLHDRRSLLWMLPDLGRRFGEAYMDGAWEPDGCTLLDVLEVAERNLSAAATAQRWPRRLRVALAHLTEINTQARSRRNVEHHYDQPYALYESFLDPDLHYSCAYFREPGMQLATAQQAKCEMIAAKLDLKPGARVLDIGCGWGGLALHLAQRHGARVTGITVSPAQLDVARRRAWERGLAQRVEFLLRDYREVTGDYDAVVSVGMFEHVGRPHYTDFFRSIRQRLKPDGVALIHTIGRSDRPDATNPWVRRYIFPGGYVPSLSEVMRPIENSGLRLTDVEVWRLHYAHTLAAWHANFQDARERFAVDLGERFCRMWEFYLRGAEAAFRWGPLVVYQLQLTRDPARLPLTRDYLYRV